MKQRDLVLALIGICGEDPQFGRTSLQKMAYLSATLFDVDLGHHAYFYGPYSSSVETDVEALWMSGLIEEKRRKLGVNNRGGEIAQYEYKITAEGAERLERLRQVYGSDLRKLEVLVHQVKEAAGSLHQHILSAVAKVHFIETMENERVESQQVKELAQNLGWRLSEPQIERVKTIVTRIEEVSEGIRAET